MELAEGTIVECLLTHCPYCGKEVCEHGAAMDDLTGWDFEVDGEIECPFCKKTFRYIIKDGTA